MYKKSIKDNSKYIIPFIEGIKFYGSNNIEHSIATMIILNDEGDVLTCKHVAREFVINDKLGKNYKKLLDEIKNNNEKKVLKKYNINNDTVVLTNINFPFKINGDLKVEILFHEYLDLAIIRFKNADLKRDNYPVFSKELPLQGQSVCKLGFAFPEYDFFEYSKEAENIVLKKEVRPNFPLFPLDGIVTRNIVDDKNNVSMFETSTPGLKGQSGGPVFSPEGLVYGIQSMTKHLDLNFDLEVDVIRGSESKKNKYTPFMSLGIAVSSVEIIKFLDKHKIKYKSE